MTGPCPFFGKNNHGDLFRLPLWIGLPNFTFVALLVTEILGVPWKFWESRDQDHTPFSKKNNCGHLFSLSLWIGLPNFTYVALPIPQILGGTLKILGVTWQGHAPFSGKIIKRICLAYHCMHTKFYIRSFTSSLDIRGYPKNFGSHVTRSRHFFEKNNQGLLLRLTRWIVLPNFTFVALPVPKILGGTFKILGVTCHATFSEKIIKGICLDYHCEYAHQILYS